MNTETEVKPLLSYCQKGILPVPGERVIAIGLISMSLRNGGPGACVGQYEVFKGYVSRLGLDDTIEGTTVYISTTKKDDEKVSIQDVFSFGDVTFNPKGFTDAVIQRIDPVKEGDLPYFLNPKLRIGK